MQFLPSTWADLGQLTVTQTARATPRTSTTRRPRPRRTCARAGADLTGSGWSAAVLSYNHDAGYVGSVYAAAEAYAERTR